MKENRRPPTESTMLAALTSGALKFPPVLVAARDGFDSRTRGREAADAVVAIRWGKREYRFAVQCKALSTPKAFAAAMDEAERGARSLGLAPLVLVPYLAPEQLAELEIRDVSGLDFCGNGIVVAPGELLVIRSGQPNQFRTEARIKNVYRKNSSLVARVLLNYPQIDSIGAAENAIKSYGVSLGTVSKVLATLADDLIIERTTDPATRRRHIRLLQPDRLLDLLAENYSPPEITRTFTGKMTLSAKDFQESLRKWQETTGGRIRETGESSVAAYAVMPREDLRTFYCSDLDSLISFLGMEVRESERFPNLKLLETRDEFVFFGGQGDAPSPPCPIQASAIQTYLELAGGDKWDRETAEQVRRRILEHVDEMIA